MGLSSKSEREGKSYGKEKGYSIGVGRRGFRTLVLLAVICFVMSVLIYGSMLMYYKSVSSTRFERHSLLLMNPPLTPVQSSLRSRTPSVKFSIWCPSNVMQIRNSRFRKILFFFFSFPDGTGNSTASETITGPGYRVSTNPVLTVESNSAGIYDTAGEMDSLQEAVKTFESYEILHVGVHSNYLLDFQYFLDTDAEEKLPFALLIDASEGWKKYMLKNRGGVRKASSSFEESSDVGNNRSDKKKSISAQELIAFENRFLHGVEQRWFRSETAYEGSAKDVMGSLALSKIRSMRIPGELQKIVSTQFQRNVLASPTDTLILFTASWCGICRTYEAKFKALAEKMKNVSSIDFLYIDTTRNDIAHDAIIIDRIPNVRFLRAKQKNEKPIYFDHSKQNVVEYGVEFLHTHSTCAFTVEQGNLNCDLGISPPPEL